MKDTEQFNIRLPKALLYDLEFISQRLKLNRNDWLRTKIAKLILQEKQDILEVYEQRYAHGFLSDEEFKNFTGISPTDGIKQLRDDISKNRKVYSKNFEKYASNVMNEFKAKKGQVYFDEYFKGILKQVDSKRKNGK